MAALISDLELTEWAEEHLIYEARMLVHTAFQLANRGDAPSDPDSNVLLESFTVHVRCLGDFFWGERHPRYPQDAFAADFCAPHVWKRERGDRPPVLDEIARRDRLGREVVHLSYHRRDVPPKSKDWPVGEILTEIIYALDHFVMRALPERLNDKTRAALDDPSTHSAGIGPASVATGIHYQHTEATAGFPSFVGS